MLARFFFCRKPTRKRAAATRTTKVNPMLSEQDNIVITKPEVNNSDVLLHHTLFLVFVQI